ncbi:hypothetical protein [Listeria booriae]|uniref:hypothetical protein n=1 Tax=Listeria booriae TaxID=1552123 RepID=UPI0016298671|nr:hypothetical protein [Listeria booriae]MBC2103728.1 hypothetical protein [Listeria booriae]
MERERALLEKQLEAATHKQRKLEDIQLALIQLNREKASILGSFQQAWQGNKADRVASQLEDTMEAEWRETRGQVNSLENQIIAEKRQIRKQLETLKEQTSHGAN